MPNEQQAALLDLFSRHCDHLLARRIVRSDSLTGDVAEYIVRRTFELSLTTRSMKDVDAVGPHGETWQVKSAVKEKTSLAIDGTKLVGVDRLAVVFFADDYSPHDLLTFQCADLPREKFSISRAFLARTPHEAYGSETILLDPQDRADLAQLGILFVQLEDAGVIRSRHIVGDIGETLACERLGLRLCPDRTHEGYDAYDAKHRYEIKTRCVYESERHVADAHAEPEEHRASDALGGQEHAGR